MSIEPEKDQDAEIIRARTEAQEAVARARRVVERSRELLLNQRRAAEPPLIAEPPLLAEPPMAG